MKPTIFLVLVLVASVALAAPTTRSPASSGTGTYEYEPSRTVKWMQLPFPGSAALASQYDWVYPFYGETADDFLCEDGVNIVAVEWWGKYWNPGAPPYAEFFTVRFYDNGGAPGYGCPCQIVYEAVLSPGVGSIPGQYAEEYDPTCDQYHYYATLPLPFPQTAGEHYWVSFQAGLVFPPQWGWCECDPIYYWGWEAMMDFALLGIPRWTHTTVATGAYYELAFVLYGPATPVDRSSWGSIKAMFR